jgi:asparagine synthase (glutamine-hydrolysing)
MCGITGIVGLNIESSIPKMVVQKMTDAMTHRGPNSQGIWNDSNCYLGHRRLSIIDLSESGNQPFISQDGRYVLVYNGELYNYKELKFSLQRTEFGANQLPYIFKTNTDTEVILASYLRWGKECVNYFNGMFAFAIWDKQEQRLVMARDRMGVKPLYYHFKNNVLLFASEIRSLLKSDLIEKKINQQSLSEYIQYATVHAPNTLLEHVKVLMPGHILEFETKHFTFTISQYWNITNFTKSKEDLDYKQTCGKVNELLTQSVERRLISDVPFGAFLSGGIDSSAIVGLMSKVSSEKIQTFTVNFDESEFSEAKYAQVIAKKFNTQHHNITLTPDDFLSQLPEALNAIDHPSGDGANTYIVSKATKNAGITMALSGLGGDELFAGYDIFKRYLELEKKAWLNLIPAKGIVGKLLAANKKSIQGDKTSEILNLDVINGINAYSINRKLFNQVDYKSLLKKSYNDNAFIQNVIKNCETDSKHKLSRVSLFEIKTYMQNVLLRDADQMSMAVALEVRVPFLDYKLVEFVLSINDTHKFPHTPKQLLVDSLGDLLPNEIINREKMGFTLPWKDWLKNELKEFCKENIAQLSKLSFVNREAVLLIWNRFLKNDPKITWSRVWHLVVLNHWIKTNHIDC